MTKKGQQDDLNLSTVHFRLSKDDLAVLDACAQTAGLPRSAYVRKIVLSHIGTEMSNKSINVTEKIIRETLEKLLDIKTKKQDQTLRTLIGEIQRANYMHLKDYIEKHPGLDISEYRSYYFQSDKEAYDFSSGKRSLDNILKAYANDVKTEKPEWLKIISGESDDDI